MLGEELGKDVEMLRIIDKNRSHSKGPSSRGSHVILSRTDSQLSVDLSDLSPSGRTQRDSEKRGDASTDDDVSHLFNHSVASEDDFLVDLKRRECLSQVQMRKLLQSAQNNNIRSKIHHDYDSYDFAVRRLKVGFVATKFNFTNNESKKVFVYLTDDEKYLCYKGENCGGFRGLFRGERKVPVSSLRNLLYGGISGNFRRYSKPVIR